MVSSEAKNSARAASSATSRAAPCVPSPISALAASTFLPSRPAMTTRAPAWWAALAVASPIPELPPITTTHASRSEPRSALPSPLTPLIGRPVAVAELAQSLVVDRLVTLAGPGGVGKTRLALRAAAEAADKFPGGTCWVELGSVTDPDGVPLALLQSLGGSYHPAVQVEEQIGALLADDPMLFVVDNCEHVLDAAADSVGALLAHANVTVLATSREALAIPGEVVWPVPALAVPADDTPADD